MLVRLATQCRTVLSSLSVTRHIHTSLSLRTLHEQEQQPLQVGEEAHEQLLRVEEQQQLDIQYEDEELENFDDDDVVSAFMEANDDGKLDTTSAGHLAIRRNRQVLYYLRLIENEIPKLVSLRRDFTPPTSATPIIVRSIDYAGEEHPATSKRTIVAPIAQLPLRDNDARHKFKVLAGVRWTPDPPKDAGVGPNETERKHGYIKISCEDFPHPAQNLKWASDVIDRLIAEANDSADSFIDIPHDTRHLVAKARKAKRGEHLSGRIFRRPTIRDFPKKWLPEPKDRLMVPEMDEDARIAAAQ